MSLYPYKLCRNAAPSFPGVLHLVSPALTTQRPQTWRLRILLRKYPGLSRHISCLLQPQGGLPCQWFCSFLRHQSQFCQSLLPPLTFFYFFFANLIILVYMDNKNDILCRGAVGYDPIVWLYQCWINKCRYHVKRFNNSVYMICAMGFPGAACPQAARREMRIQTMSRKMWYRFS